MEFNSWTHLGKKAFVKTFGKKKQQNTWSTNLQTVTLRETYQIFFFYCCDAINPWWSRSGLKTKHLSRCSSLFFQTCQRSDWTWAGCERVISLAAGLVDKPLPPRLLLRFEGRLAADLPPAEHSSRSDRSSSRWIMAHKLLIHTGLEIVLMTSNICTVAPKGIVWDKNTNAIKLVHEFFFFNGNLLLKVTLTDSSLGLDCCLLQLFLPCLCVWKAFSVLKHLWQVWLRIKSLFGCFPTHKTQIVVPGLPTNQGGSGCMVTGTVPELFPSLSS